MYRTILCGFAVLVCLLAALPDDAAAQAKKPKVEQGTEQDYQYMAQTKSFSAQLISFDDSAKTITVRYSYSVWVPNEKFNAKAANNNVAHLIQHQNQLSQEQARLAAAKNPGQAAGHMRQIAHLQNLIGQEMAKLNNVNPNNLPFKAVQHQKDFDLDMQTAVSYRKMFLPQEYDDTGNLKTYSEKEKAELRGKDPNPKSSYSAKASEFHPGQQVGVYLTPPKKGSSSSSSSSSSTTADDGKGTKKTTGSDDEPAVQKPTVRMLVIVQEGNLPAGSTADKNPKKKN